MSIFYNNVYNSFKTLPLVVTALLYAALSIAQSQKIEIRSEYFSIHNGLNVAEIFKIQEDSDGMIWLASENGLLRYDAHSFVQFRHDVNDPSTLSSNYIKDMCMDKHGRLWLSANNQLDVFDTKTFKVTHIRNDSLTTSSKNLGFHFTYDKTNDVMWMCTEKGIFINNGKNINVVKKEMPKSMPTYFGYCRLLLDGDVIWIMSGKGLHKWHHKSEQYKTYHSSAYSEKIGVEGFISIAKDVNGIIWLGNWSFGMHRFDPVTEKMVDYRYRHPNLQNTVHFFHEMNIGEYNGLLLSGTLNGLKIFDTVHSRFLSDSLVQFGISDKITVFSMWQSKHSGIWIGTSKGLYRLDMESRFLKKVPLGLKANDAFLTIENLIFEPCRKDSIMWFVGGYERLVKYDLTKKVELPLPKKLFPYAQAERGIYEVYIDSKSTLWISSMKDTLIGYSINEDKIIKPIFTTNNPVAVKIVEGSNNDLWLASVHGLIHYESSKNVLMKNKDVDFVLTKLGFSKKLLRLSIDNNGNLWMASGWSDERSGLVFYNPRTHVVKVYDTNKIKQLQHIVKIEDLASTDKELLICGISGIARGHYNNSGLVDLSNPKNDIIWSGKELRYPRYLKNGIACFRTKHGIINYNLANDQIFDLTHINSKLSLEINALSYSANTKRLYITHPNQLEYFDVDSTSIFMPQKVQLSNMAIANFTLQSLPPSGAHLKLKNYQNSIQFEFTNLSFNNSMANSYLYKVNQSLVWKKMIGNKLSFDGLGAGDYHLEVISSNSNGTINFDPFLLTFSVLPPFYQTWWFFSLCICTFGLLFYFLYRLKVKELERLQKVRLSIARDLHDDMGSNLSYIKMLSEVESISNPDQTVFHTIVQKMTEVMNNMSEIIWNANPKNDKIEDVLHRVQEFAITTLEPLNIGVMSDIDDLHRDLSLDIEAKRHLYLIFKEAINNIGKYAKATKVTITASSSGNRIYIKIVDNGIGFDPLLIKRGNGLINMQERAAQLNGRLEVNTSEKGTSIELILS